MSTPWAWADPALVALALDPELLAMVAAVGLALARDDARGWLAGLRRRCRRRSGEQATAAAGTHPGGGPVRLDFRS